MSKVYNNILVFSDLHAPAQHKDTVPFLKAVVARYGDPDLVVCNGDILDFHACSRWERDRSLPDAHFELDMAIESLRDLFKAFPDVSMTWGNHDIRVMKKAASVGISPKLMIGLLQALGAPDTWTVSQTLEVRSPLGDILFTHDAGSKLIEKVVSFIGSSIVQGHYHREFSIRYVSRGYDPMFGMTSGCLVDVKHPAFAYTKTSSGMARFYTPAIGCAMIINGVPHLIPMHQTGCGRWTGRLL